MAGVAAEHRAKAIECLRGAFGVALEPSSERERNRLVEEAVDELILATQLAIEEAAGRG